MHTCFFNMYGIHGFLDTDLRRGMFNCLVLDTSKVSQPFRYIQITEVVDGLLHHQQAEKLDDAKRILCAPSVWLWMKKIGGILRFRCGDFCRSSTTVVIKHGASEISHKYHKWMGNDGEIIDGGVFGILCAEFFWTSFAVVSSDHFNDLKSRDLSSRYCMQWWYSLLYVHIYRTLIWIE